MTGDTLIVLGADLIALAVLLAVWDWRSNIPRPRAAFAYHGHTTGRWSNADWLKQRWAVR